MNLNKLDIQRKIEGNDRINDMIKMPLSNKNLFPKPISYLDIDEAVMNFVDKNFVVDFGANVKLGTFLFVQERLNEFSKTWEMLDENNNLIPNFKIVTRENNPKPGTLLGDGMANIPGEPLFPLGTFEKWDGNKNITVSYKMKQPYCVDLTYNIKFVTNKLFLLNQLNNCVINKFKSKQTYITLNGFYIPIILKDISDESDYNLDDRKIYIQNYELLVMAFIINEDDLIVEENMVRSVGGISLKNEKTTNKSIFYKSSDGLDVIFPKKSKTFKTIQSDGDYLVQNIITDSNILSYSIELNGQKIDTPFKLEKYDLAKFVIERSSPAIESKIILQTN